MRKIDIGGFHRVTKSVARRLYEQNLEDLYICPVNMNPTNMWMPALNMASFEHDSFEAAINSFEYYNCNAETGEYAAFYVKED